MPDTLLPRVPVWIVMGDNSAPWWIGDVYRHEGETTPEALARVLRAAADEVEQVQL